MAPKSKTAKALPAKPAKPAKASLIAGHSAATLRNALRETVEQHRVSYMILAKNSGVAQRLIRLAVENNGALSDDHWRDLAFACPAGTPLHALLNATPAAAPAAGEKPVRVLSAGAAHSHVIRVPLKLLRENPENYRQTHDDKDIAELAASIKSEGLLQNLVTFPADAKGLFTVNSGNRRYRALKLLEKRRDIDADYLVHIYPKTMTADEALSLAIIENLQRQDVDALEEADGFARLATMKWSTERIAKSVGMSQRFVQDRLQLSTGLFTDARRALKDKKITIEQARAIVTAPRAALQKEMLERANLYGRPQTGDELRKWLKGVLPALAVAGFDVALYKGEFVGEGKARLFADVEAFSKLQRDAARAIAADLRKSFDKATLLKADDYFANWKYEAAPDGTAGEAFVLIDKQSHKIIVHKGLVLSKGRDDDIEEDDDDLEGDVEGNATREAERAAKAAAQAATDDALKNMAMDMIIAVRERPANLLRITLLGMIVSYEIDIYQTFPQIELDSDDIVQLMAALDIADLKPEGVKHFRGIGNEADTLAAWAKIAQLPDAQVIAIVTDVIARENASRFRSQSIAPLDLLIFQTIGVDVPAILLPKAAPPVVDATSGGDTDDSEEEAA
tara:strand:- start:3348 stop:5216 length:1869 start_codon:yes stop_codon:yes gene_type:complete